MEEIDYVEESKRIIYKARNLVYYWGIDTRQNPNYHTPLSQLRERINRCLYYLQDPYIREEIISIQRCLPKTIKKENVPEIMSQLKQLSSE